MVCGTKHCVNPLDQFVIDKEGGLGPRKDTSFMRMVVHKEWRCYELLRGW